MLQTVLKKAITRGVRASGEPIAFTPEAMVADQLVDVRRRRRLSGLWLLNRRQQKLRPAKRERHVQAWLPTPGWLV